MLLCERDQLGILGDELVQAALEVEARFDRLLQELAPGRREASSLRGDADERRGRAVLEGVRDRSDDRDALVGLARSLRVEDRDGRGRAVVDDARIVFP